MQFEQSRDSDAILALGLQLTNDRIYKQLGNNGNSQELGNLRDLGNLVSGKSAVIIVHVNT